MVKHLACIMDGNRRWAKKRGWLPWYGHKQGVKAVEQVIDFCLEQNISYLSLYTFSIENFKRPFEETKYLFKLIIDQAKTILESAHKNNIRIQFVGDRDLFPEQIMPVCEQLEKETATYDALYLNLLFCYGARQEMASGMRAIAHKVKMGELLEKDITPEVVSEHLWLHSIPEPDLIIRTGGSKRLSNFLLFQAAYSEFYFLDCLWPEITKVHLQNAVDEFNGCKRNFGT